MSLAPADSPANPLLSPLPETGAPLFQLNAPVASPPLPTLSPALSPAITEASPPSPTNVSPPALAPVNASPPLLLVPPPKSAEVGGLVPPPNTVAPVTSPPPPQDIPATSPAREKVLPGNSPPTPPAPVREAGPSPLPPKPAPVSRPPLTVLSPQLPPMPATISPPSPNQTTFSPPKAFSRPPSASPLTHRHRHILPPPLSTSPLASPPDDAAPLPFSSEPATTVNSPELAPPTPPSSSLSQPVNRSFPAAVQVNKPLVSPRPNVSTGLVLGSVFGGVALLVLLLLALVYLVWIRNQKDTDGGSSGDCRKPSFSSLGQIGSCLDKTVLSLDCQGQAPRPGTDHVITVTSNSSLPPPHLSSAGGPVPMNSKPKNPIPTQINGSSLRLSHRTFTYEQLVVATNGFSKANLLGQGGFGHVHKGVLPCGKEVAVKKLKLGSQQGEREFQAEVETVSRVHHKHLVSLVGYCVTGAERLLVYEFVPNNTLEFHLHGTGRPVMEWATRLRIATGSAKGLSYLHEDCNPTIIHRDIKASNILLDDRFEAKVSDFGLARFFSGSNALITHITTQVMGTFGYLAPEYASSGKLTEKSDVYSFGVMLLELITGRPPISMTDSFTNEGLVDWAKPLLSQALENGSFDGLVDPRLQGNYNKDEMARMAACAAACVRHSASLRPRMSQIVHALEGGASMEDLEEGSRPGTMSFSVSSPSSGNETSSYYRENLGRLHQTLSGGEYTSEYGLNPSGSSGDSQRTP